MVFVSNPQSTIRNSQSRLPHWLAVVLCCATFPLIWVGGLVTTTQAGMAVPDWPTTYGYNMFSYPWQTWLFGPWDLFIEHGHRLLGSLVGLISIVFCVAVWRCDERRWLRWLSVGVVVAVIGQGVLGGMRVLLDERTLAKIHGCTGPLFFGLCAAMAVFTSSTWHTAQRQTLARGANLHRLAIATTWLAYLQLMLGAQVRHVSVSALPGEYRAAVLFHLLMAVFFVIHVVLLAWMVFRNFRGDARLTRPVLLLCVLTGIQVCLGGATWVAKFAWPDPLAQAGWGAGYTIVAGSFRQSLIVTAHMATGSLILVTALVVALRSVRGYRAEPKRHVEVPKLAGVML